MAALLATALAIRLATPDDERELRDLALLDGARPLRAPVLVAEVNGVLSAALELHGYRVAADPFVRTDDLLAHLRLRAERLRTPVASPRRRWRALAAMRRRIA